MFWKIALFFTLFPICFETFFYVFPLVQKLSPLFFCPFASIFSGFPHNFNDFVCFCCIGLKLFPSASRKFPECSRKFSECSRTFSECSRTFPDCSRTFPESSRKFLDLCGNFWSLRGNSRNDFDGYRRDFDDISRKFSKSLRKFLDLCGNFWNLRGNFRSLCGPFCVKFDLHFSIFHINFSIFCVF